MLNELPGPMVECGDTFKDLSQEALQYSSDEEVHPICTRLRSAVNGDSVWELRDKEGNFRPAPQPQRPTGRGLGEEDFEDLGEGAGAAGEDAGAAGDGAAEKAAPATSAVMDGDVGDKE